MDNSILVVNIKTMSVYSFKESGETETDLLKRAEDYKAKQIETWIKHCESHPSDQFEAYLKESWESEYKVMTWDEYEKLQKTYHTSKPLHESTEEEFDDMLNCLPPLKWCTIAGVEMFCMSEMWTGTYTSQYARYKGKYYSKMVDVTDKSTWINNYIAI